MSEILLASTTVSSDYLLNSSREYAIYINRNRAIPYVGDGLKHGQMLALWLLRNRAEKMKTFALSGLMGYERLYVHGEVSANDTIGKLAAPFKNNVPLITGHGQFGTRISPVKGIGAPRYTEIQRSKAAEAFLYVDLDLVELEDNYDGSNKQPVNFLPIIPTVLLNGVSGVGLGWSTDILPRSFKSLIEATKDALLGKPLKIIEPYYNRYNITVKNLKQNQWEFSGKATVVDSSTIRVIELPPNTSLESFREKLAALEDSEEIVSFSDSSSESIDITIRMKRGSVKAWSDDDAINFLKIREKATERIVVVNWDGHSIRVYPTAESLIEDFAAWRLGWYTKRFEKLRDDTNDELIYWKALKILFENGFTKKLGTFEDKAAMEVEVTRITTSKKLNLDKTHLDKVVSLPTFRWTKQFEAEVGEKISHLSTAHDLYVKTLLSPDLLKQAYINDLDGLKNLKY